MITYETIRRIEQEEKQFNKLSILPPNFLHDVMAYLEKKAAISSEKGDDLEHQASVRRFESIAELRERKIVNFALSFVRSGAVPENMTAEERQMFDRIAGVLQEFRKKRKKVMSGERFNMLTVAFLQDMHRFVGIDMANYGPFSSGDIASIPEENAKLIIEKGAAEVVVPGR